MFPAQPPVMQQQQPPAAPLPRRSKKLLAILAGLIVVGGIITIVVFATRKKEHQPDIVDLGNDELEAVRDDACKCKDEACLRAAIARVKEIDEQTQAGGKAPDREQFARGQKINDQIGECIDKVVKAMPGTGSVDGQDLINEQTALRDAFCACKDAECAGSLLPRLDRFRDAYLPRRDSLSPEVNRQIRVLFDSQKTCIDRLTGHARDDANPALFAGSYKTSEGAMTLEQSAADPTKVTGTYAKGTITCTASGATLDCAWDEKTSSGHAHFKRAANGDMTGSWGSGTASSGGGVWNCTLLTPGALR